MVKVIPLAAVVIACVLCAPAQADVLPVPPPSAAVTTAAQVVDTVRPAVTQVTTAASAQAPVAKPAVQAAVQKTVETTTVQTAPGRVDGNGGLRVGASSLRRAPSARLRRSEPPRRAGAPARRTHPTPATPASPREPRAAHPTAPAHPASAHPNTTPQAHGQPAPPTDGGVAAGGASTGFAAGLALLAVALLMAAPRLSRRLRIHVDAPRPFAFVALLERPG